MGIGISDAAAELWANDPVYGDDYEELFLESAGGYSYFAELPDWAYVTNVGPFYVDEDGAIYSISMTPSQTGDLIGNLAD